jgi:hypothetical protein
MTKFLRQEIHILITLILSFKSIILFKAKVFQFTFSLNFFYKNTISFNKTNLFLITD